MPPKKPAADSVKEENPGARRDDVYVFPAGVLAMRKLPHPSTTVMVKEALKELDSRRGCSSQAIQRYIKEEYPSVDAVRLKHFVRRALNKGLESGDLVRPANSSVTTGAMGKFRVTSRSLTLSVLTVVLIQHQLLFLSRFKLAPKLKKPKPKSENVDPNEQKEPEKKDEAKKPPKRGLLMRGNHPAANRTFHGLMCHRCQEERGQQREQTSGGEGLLDGIVNKLTLSAI